MKYKLYVIVMIAFQFVPVFGQTKTVGLVLNDTTKASKGYTLFSTPYPVIYLIDGDGMLVHSWPITDNTERVMISEDGYLYRGINLPDSVHPVFGKPIGGVEKQDWDGNVIWRFIYSGADYSRHHDVEVLPSGNVLLVAYGVKDSAQCIQAGRDPTSLKNGMLFADYIVELQPVGDTGAPVVWEWHFWDHLIQDFDATKDNFGVVGNHPELIDVNGGDQKNDWPHLNSVYYKPEYDQVIFNCAHTSELYVIDHSTTTAEAAGHTGGRYGKGGDILYRWGNPQIYDQGGVVDQKLFVTHDAEFVPSGYVSAGHITTFNNGVGRGYSSVEEIVPPVDSNGFYSLTGSKFGPSSAIWTWTASNPADYYFPIGGTAQRLPNGNTLVPNDGETFQIAPDKSIVWRYINPVNNKGPVNQGDSITDNHIGDVRFYPPGYTGFTGKDLTPKGTIEIEGVEETGVINQVDLKLYPNIVSRSASVSYQLVRPGYVQIKIYNALGKEVTTLVDEVQRAGTHQATWDGRSASSGIYFCTFSAGGYQSTIKMVLLKNTNWRIR